MSAVAAGGTRPCTAGVPPAPFPACSETLVCSKRRPQNRREGTLSVVQSSVGGETVGATRCQWNESVPELARGPGAGGVHPASAGGWNIVSKHGGAIMISAKPGGPRVACAACARKDKLAEVQLTRSRGLPIVSQRYFS